MIVSDMMRRELSLLAFPASSQVIPVQAESPKPALFSEDSDNTRVNEKREICDVSVTRFLEAFLARDQTHRRELDRSEPHMQIHLASTTCM